MNRIEVKFRELKRKGKKAFIVFITAGYPDLKLTKRLIFEFDRIGVDILELGVPFSDPLADGPIIQEASEIALKKKTNLNNILDLVKRVRRDIQIPICLMSYYNPIFCFGQKRFFKKARQCGVDGLIVPDLPVEEGRAFIREAEKEGLDTILFVAPTTTLKRLRFILRLAKGFIYYISLTGVTGPRNILASDLIKNLRLIKRYTSKPVCVGFGISNPSQVKQIYQFADGVIVGSAIIKKIKDNLDKKYLLKKVIKFVETLKGR
ncbi:MAG: tryptophan synthase subunit alpha [Candidatus Omnitrophica bacterium]|nr:tryptophan synthase subunit alpha [Candidatus Omnitrophota bacterium]